MPDKKHRNDFIAAQRERAAFFQSDAFNTLIDAFNAHASQKGMICQERLKYADLYDEQYAFTADEFGRVCDTLFNALGDDVRHVGGGVPVFELEYQGLTFGLSIGQGSSYDCKLTPQP